MKAKATFAVPDGWFGQASFAKVSRRGGATLMVAVQRAIAEWKALAFETTASTGAGVLASHAHDDLGSFPDPVAAIKAAERYAASWTAGKPLCECKTIRKRGRSTTAAKP